MNNVAMPSLGSEATQSIASLLGDFSFSQVIEDLQNGSFRQDPQGIFDRAVRIFMGELSESLSLIGALTALLVMCAFVQNLQTSFENKSTTAAAHYAFFVYLAAINAAAFETACGYCTQTVNDITALIHGIVPTMALIGAGGGAIYAAAANPVIFFVCGVYAALIRKVITPLVLLRCASVLLCGISQNESMGEFSDIFSKLHKTLLSFSMSLFAGILTVSRFAAVSFDNLYARGIKFAVTSAIPVVGGSISEAMSTVAGSAMVLKSAVGIAGVIMLFAIFAVPLLRLAAMCVVYRVAAAIASPVADKRIIRAIKQTGECVDMLLVSVACMGIIMIIAIASII